MKEFADHFWGEKNNGFDVLYHNMKHGYISSKELADFIRDRCQIEENYARLLAKLAKAAANSSSVGTFSPVWQILKNSSERLSGLHMGLTHKFQEIVKDIQKYNEEQHKKHRSMKDQESGTLEVVQSMQQTTQLVQKSKETYTARCLEYEKLKRDAGTSPKDLEKAEVKFKKALDEYKLYLEKYSSIRSEFEKKMLVSCRNFQEVEIEHLRKMKSFIETYAKSAESNHTLIQQVHVEFKQQADEQTVEKLVDQFILVKSTGIEKPGPIEFEEVDLSNLPPAPSPDQQEKINVANDNKAKEKGFLSRTKREKKKKKKKEAAAAAQAHVETVEKKEEDCCVNDASSERNSITSKDSKESSKTPEVDEEGFTIRPENINSERRVPYDSSGTSDSDSDDDEQKKFTVNIRPLGHSHPIAASVDELRATVERMSLSPVTVASPHERKKVMIVEATMKRSQSLSDPFSSKPSSDLLELEFQGAPPNSAASTPTGAYSGVKSPPLNAPSSGHSTPVTGIDHQVDQEVASFPPPVPKAVSGSSIAIPRPPSRSRERPRTTTPGMQQHGRGRMSPAQPVMARADSVSSVGSVGSESFKTTSAPVSCSRGPSPLALGMADTVPLAVAFTETIHAYFKGVDETKCKVKIQGYMLVSFPAGIVQVLANNPNLTPLSFRLRESSRIEGIVLNRQLVSVDAEKSAEEGPVYAFDMATLRDHLKRQAESSPSASFFNVDIMKYQVKAESGAGSCPLHLRSHWRCDDDTTSLRVDYRYHQAGAHGCTLTQIACVVTVDGGVTSLQAIPQAAWASDTQRVTWKLATLNQHSESSSGASGGGALRAKFALNNGPSTPSTLAAQFVAEGRTLSGADAELVGPGYRLSLVKRRYAAGKYYCDADVEAKYS